MRYKNTDPIPTGRRAWPTVLVLTAALLVGAAGPAEAGVSVGFAVSNGGFSFALGYSDYPVYSPAWNQPSFSLSFETTLAGYGEWVTVAGMGRVWRPWVAPGWRPYTWGRWVYTSYGWTWVAYEPWGYVPHHYGSWAMTSFGWVWCPGYVYRPANVAWVSCGSYVGWYPAPPPGWSHARHTWWNGYRAGHFDGYRAGYNNGYADGWKDARYGNFVRWNQMTVENVASVATPGSRFRELRPGSVRVLSSSPSRVQVQRAVGRPIPTVRVSERTVSMGGRSVRAVRPAGVETSIATYSRQTVRRSLAPSVVRTMDRGARVTERPSTRSTSASGALSSRSGGISRSSSTRAARFTGSSSAGDRGTSRASSLSNSASALQADRVRGSRTSTRSLSRDVSSPTRSSRYQVRQASTAQSVGRSRNSSGRIATGQSSWSARSAGQAERSTLLARASSRSGSVSRSAHAARSTSRSAGSRQLAQGTTRRLSAPSRRTAGPSSTSGRSTVRGVGTTRGTRSSSPKTSRPTGSRSHSSPRRNPR